MPTYIRSTSAPSFDDLPRQRSIRMKHHHLSIDELSNAKKAWMNGATGPQLARAFNVPVAYIYSAVSDKRRQFHRITAEEKRKMQELRNAGFSVRRIAAAFNCCEATVRRYARMGMTEQERRDKIKRAIIKAYTRNHQENLMAGTWSNPMPRMPVGSNPNISGGQIVDFPVSYMQEAV